MSTDSDVRAYNRNAWDLEVDRENPWTRPVSPEVVAQARAGNWSVLLTECKPVPRHWFPHDMDIDLLCLASGGGQQGPILAAAGARVTVLDNAPRQLAQDRFVAERDALALQLVEGDMADLSPFASGSFDLVFHPVSNCFASDVRPVWREAFRVLRHGGRLLAGFLNPALFMFDPEEADRGPLVVRHSIPYEDRRDLAPERLATLRAEGRPMEFSHTLTDQIGGQLDAGFVLTDMYEDRHSDFAPARYFATYLATCALKPEPGVLPFRREAR
jgi:SAM-dependent methyltransferase